MLEQIDSVDWANIRVLMGTAENVPDAIRALASNDPEMCHKGRQSLEGAIVNSGGLYEAAYHTIPFLVEILAREGHPGREGIYDLFVEMAQSWAEGQVVQTSEFGTIPLRDAVRMRMKKGVPIYLKDLRSNEGRIAEWALAVLEDLGQLPAAAEDWGGPEMQEFLRMTDRERSNLSQMFLDKPYLPHQPADALTDEERATYEWQMWSPGFGEEGQRRLKNSTVLISRCGGLGSVVAYELAAAGVGHLVIAHGGDVKHSDLNRQLLMTHDWLGKPRIETIERRLKDLNPRLKVTPIAENISDTNASEFVGLADVVVDAAPMFEERFAMNAAAFAQGKPVVECAMYDLEATITTISPTPGKGGGGPCLRCLVPEVPGAWTRQFPVFGAVSGTVGCMGAMEAVKLLSGVGEALVGRMVRLNLREMKFRTVKTYADPGCVVCGGGG